MLKNSFSFRKPLNNWKQKVKRRNKKGKTKKKAFGLSQQNYANKEAMRTSYWPLCLLVIYFPSHGKGAAETVRTTVSQLLTTSLPVYYYGTTIALLLCSFLLPFFFINLASLKTVTLSSSFFHLFPNFFFFILHVRRERKQVLQRRRKKNIYLDFLIMFFFFFFFLEDDWDDSEQVTGYNSTRIGNKLQSTPIAVAAAVATVATTTANITESVKSRVAAATVATETAVTGKADKNVQTYKKLHEDTAAAIQIGKLNIYIFKHH